MTQSAIPPSRRPVPLRARLVDWGKTTAIALLVIPFPAFLLWAAFSTYGGIR